MESRQIGWFAPECSENELARMDLLDADGYEERERKEGEDNATGRLMSELPSAPPSTIVVDD